MMNEIVDYAMVFPVLTAILIHLAVKIFYAKLHFRPELLYRSNYVSKLFMVLRYDIRTCLHTYNGIRRLKTGCS